MVEVDIYWPHQAGNDKKLGKWLLYLEDVPKVNSTSGGECTISEKDVNPLNLTAHDMASLTAPVMQPSNKKENQNKTSSSSSGTEKKSSNEEIVSNRVRRDHSMIIKADKLVDADGKKTNIVVMVRRIIENNHTE